MSPLSGFLDALALRFSWTIWTAWTTWTSRCR